MNKVAAVDYDGTLMSDVGFPKHGTPVSGAMQGVSLLKRFNYKVIVHSCRTNPMDPETGRPRFNQSAIASGAADMYRRLRAAGIQVDEVYTAYGKPYADVYVDDKGVGWGGWEAASLHVIGLERGVDFTPEFSACYCRAYRALLKKTQVDVVTTSRRLLSEDSGASQAEASLRAASERFRQAATSISGMPNVEPWILQDLEDDEGACILSSIAQQELTGLLTEAASQLNTARSSLPKANLQSLAESLLDVARSIKDGLPSEQTNRSPK